MKMRGKKLTALLLALCIVLGLAACGSDGENKNGDAEQLSGTVYVPKFIELDAEFNYISGGCCNGENVYIAGTTENEEELTDPDTGETYTNTIYEEGIYKISLETGEMTELENYEPGYSFENYDEGWFSLDGLRGGADGTIWVTERANIYEYNLPEDFNEETDAKWEYQTSTEVQLMRQLDGDGKELQRLDTSGIREKLSDWNYIGNILAGADGCLYVSGAGANGSKLAVLDKDKNVLFTLDDDSWGEFITLSDGNMAMRRRNSEGSLKMSVLDKEAKGWGTTEYEMPYAAASQVYDGAGKYLFYYNSGESLYGYNAESQEGEKLLSWSTADINMDRLVFFTFLEDGRVVAMTQDWGEEGQTIELAVLEETERSTVPEKTILTFATMGLSSDMRSSIIKFNKSSDKYRIEIRDYSEYNTEEDYQAGLTKLNTEILAGNVPDILETRSLPMRQFAAKGLLEDLWPLIDSDPDISRDGLMERVFQVAEKDGKLYEAIENFSITTVIGSPKVVGDEMGWTLAELQAALATMPEGCTIFGESDTKTNMLQYVLAMNVDAYVDWDTGECDFESDAFKAVLAFCNSFPLEYDWEANRENREDDSVRIAEGRQMLMVMTVDGFRDIQIYEAMFTGDDGLQTFNLEYNYGSNGGSYSVVVSGSGSAADVGVGAGRDMNQTTRLRPGKHVTFKGFPMEDGSCGSSFTTGNSLAMSSTCKDKEGAWSFVREMLLPKADRKYYSSWSWGFPSNKEDFDALVEESMQVEYLTDGEGKQVLDPEGNPVEQSKGGWSWGDSLSIDCVATTQQEYDQIMELYNTIDSISSYESSIYDIVSDLAGSYFNGDKTLDETASLIQGRVQLYINENR